MTRNEKGDNTLHEMFSNSFTRSPDGYVVAHELKTVFSIMIICLSLEEKPKVNNNKLISLGKKTFPYTFSISRAVELLQNLELEVEMNSTNIYISYSIKPELGYRLLDTFMEAKLLHTPADKTRSRPKEGILLQPTPKGVAVTCEYARKVALKKLPPILTSNFNSMDLFKFERNSVDDTLIQSEYFINLLFSKVMGPKPNVWSPKRTGDKVPKLSTLLEQRTSALFSFENVSLNEILKGVDANSNNFGNSLSHKSGILGTSDMIDPAQLEDETRESPFAHRFFSNPDSDSHTQYYVSDCGLRLFENKSFGKEGMVIDYCFTTKALWQWLMECTDIMNPKEAVSVAALFLKYGLITPILLPPSENSKKKFIISKSAYYTFTQSGWDVIQWKKDSERGNHRHLNEGSKLNLSLNSRNVIKKDELSYACKSTKEAFSDSEVDLGENLFPSPAAYSDSGSSSGTETEIFVSKDSKSWTLKQILADPGMRYLFKIHLSNDLCVENLEVYYEITKFMRQMLVLRKLIECRNPKGEKKANVSDWKSGGSKKLKDALHSALLKQTNECLSLVYQIYSAYIAPGAPYQLNIDHNVRESITSIIFNPRSPSKKSFDISCREYELEQGSKSEDVKDSVQTGVHAASGKKTSNPTNKVDVTQMIDDAMYTLKEIYPHFEKVRRSVYKMMKTDSLPKFLVSESYLEATSLLSSTE